MKHSKNIWMDIYLGRLMPKIPKSLRMTAVVRGHFATLPFKRDDNLAVSSINIHDMYLNTQ